MPEALNRCWYNTWKAASTGERIVLPACRAWLDSVEYPILHLDFETIASATALGLIGDPRAVEPLLEVRQDAAAGDAAPAAAHALAMLGWKP
jgi:hypothetical protein